MRDSHTIIPIAKPLLSPTVLLISRLHHLKPSVSVAVQPFPFLAPGPCNRAFATSAAHIRGSRCKLFRFRLCLVPNLRSTSAPLPRRSTPSNLGPSILSRVSRGKSRGKLAGEDSPFLNSISHLPSIVRSTIPFRSFVSQLGAIKKRVHFLIARLRSTSIYFLNNTAIRSVIIQFLQLILSIKISNNLICITKR